METVPRTFSDLDLRRCDLGAVAKAGASWGARVLLCTSASSADPMPRVAGHLGSLHPLLCCILQREVGKVEEIPELDEMSRSAGDSLSDLGLTT